jgi:hypothetical protein
VEAPIRRFHHNFPVKGTPDCSQGQKLGLVHVFYV